MHDSLDAQVSSWTEWRSSGSICWDGQRDPLLSCPTQASWRRSLGTALATGKSGASKGLSWLRGAHESMPHSAVHAVQNYSLWSRNLAAIIN